MQSSVSNLLLPTGGDSSSTACKLSAAAIESPIERRRRWRREHYARLKQRASSDAQFKTQWNKKRASKSALWRIANKERNKENRVRRMQKIKNDPNLLEKHKQQCRKHDRNKYRKWIAKIKSDPVIYSAWKEKMRKLNALSRAHKTRAIRGKQLKLGIVLERRKSGPKPKYTPEQRLSKTRAYNMLPHVKERRERQLADKLKDPGYLLAYRKRAVESFKRNKLKVYAYRNNRRKTNKQFQISSNLRTYIYQRVGAKNTTGQSRFLKVVGCSISVFCQWLEAHFADGMSWDNYGKGHGRWSIDHHIPCAAFDLSNDEQLAKCFHFSNMFPMWWHDNLMKSDRLPV